MVVFTTSRVLTKQWLQAKRGQQKDFEAAMQILRGKDADISEEAKEVQVLILLYITLCLCFTPQC